MAQENLTDKYQVELEQFLQRLRAEIDILPSLPTGNNDGLEIDEYICQLNTFYYQSFDHHFMPVYLQQVQQSVNEALKLSRTQTMVKKDIMAIIKRYAGLYNKVKTISHLLMDAREHLETCQIISGRSQKVRRLQLLNRLEQLLNSLHAVHKMVAPTMQLWNNAAYTSAMTSSGLSREAARVWDMIDPDNPQMVTEANRLYQTLHIIVNLTADFSPSVSLENARDILDNIKESNRLPGIGTSIVHSWWEDSLRPSLTWNIELMDLYLQQGQVAEAAVAARSLQKWLEPLVTVLKQQQSLLAKGVRPAPFYSGKDFSIARLAKLEQKLTESEQDIAQRIADLASPTSYAWDNIYDDLSELLPNEYEYYQALNHNALTQVCLNIFLIITGLDSDRLQQNAVSQLSGYYQEILDWNATYYNLLKNISSDLERLLAPRNLTRIWKGMDIRVEQMELKVGNQFPEEFVNLLDRYQVETRIAEQDRTILHAEGDLFIIKVDELSEEEIPYLIVGMKGKTDATGN